MAFSPIDFAGPCVFNGKVKNGSRASPSRCEHTSILLTTRLIVDHTHKLGLLPLLTLLTGWRMEGVTRRPGMA